MRPDLIKDLDEKEVSYWWSVSKRRIVTALMENATSRDAHNNHGLGVDVGCGGGYTAKVFDSTYNMVAVDMSEESLRSCRRRGLQRLCRGDVAGLSLPFKTGSFDMVLALDVIEHIEDDLSALIECGRILKKGGFLVVTVPAFMALWSPWDEALGHRRRYTAPSLDEKIRKAGLSSRRLTYIFFFVFPIAVFVRRLKGIFHRNPSSYSSDFIPIPPLLNRFLIQVGRLEEWAVTRLNLRLPFGLSVLSLITKG